MSFDWKEYLDLARNLKAEATDAAYRSAISRAYYSAFHAGKDFCRGRIQLTDRGEDHSIVREFLSSEFGSSGDGELRDISTSFSGLQRDRMSADYDKDFRGRLDSSASLAVERAQKVRERIDYHLRTR